MEKHLYPVAALACLLSITVSPVGAASWDPIPPEELQSTQSPVDPDAPVEIMLKDVRLSSSSTETETTSYIRLKVYNQKGVAELAKFDLDAPVGGAIRRVEGRMVKPDGTIVPLEEKTIVTRDGVRIGAHRSKVTSFTFPQLEPGAIVEYRWVQIDQRWFLGVYLPFQSKWPARCVRFHVRLYAYTPGEVRTIWFKSSPQNSKADREGYLNYEEKNVPALHTEPFAPPDSMTQSWVLTYNLADDEKGDKYWRRRGQRLADNARESLQPGGDVGKQAALLTQGMTDESEKLRRLYDFCISEIRNTSLQPEGESIEERMRSHRPAQVLSRRKGSSDEINTLFASMAKALKFDARFADVADRSVRFFDRAVTAWLSLPDRIVAVRSGDGWKFFDPGSGHVPFGSLRWENENVTALIGDPKAEVMVKTSESPAEFSHVQRNAEVSIDRDGTLTGRVTFAYTGHLAVDRKLDFRELSDEARRLLYRDALAERLGDVEVTDFVVTNLDHVANPLTVAFSVRVAGYAERAGRRLFVQPAFFQKGRKPEFPDETRRHDIYFNYPWQEDDRVTLTAPEGFTLEKGSAPHALDGGRVYTYAPELAWVPSKRSLRYKRAFRFAFVLFKREAYPVVKREFDAMFVEDGHTITLLENDAPASGAGSQP